FRTEIVSATGIEPQLYVRDYFTNDMYWGTEAYPYMLASEPAEMTGGIAFTVQSMYASKPWMGSPISDLPALERGIDQIRPQLLAITYLTTSFIYERELGIRWSEVAPSRVRIVGPSAYYSGFITLKGKVLAYNLTVGWYRTVPHTIVQMYVGSLTLGGYFSPPYPFNKIVTIADENGEFEVHGLAPYPLIPGVGAAGGGLVRSMYVVEAWKIDEESGQITYAPDFGLYGAKAVVPAVSPLAPLEEVSVVVSRFNVATLFDLFNPKEGRPSIIPDPRTLSYGDTFTAFYAVGGGIQVFDFNTRGEPLFYGAYFNGYEPMGLAFFQPGSSASITFRIGGLAQPVAVRPTAIVVNASIEEPEGSGISKDGLIVNAFDYARDLLLVAKNRYQSLMNRGVRSLSVEEKLHLAEQLYNNSLKMRSERKYSLAYPQVVAAWAVAQRAYEEIMSLVDDSSRTSLFFFALIIPAAIFMERLLFHREGKSRILATVLVGGLLISFFAASHPALHVMVNSFMALLGMVAILLFLITTSILADETRQALRELSYRLLGMHEVETRRVAVTSSAFTVSVENMRKRKLRTLLTMLTFLSITIAVTSLTSVSPFETVKEVPLGAAPTYSGILLKSGFGVPPRDAYHPMLVQIVEGIISGVTNDTEFRMLPRVWYYPTSVGPRTGVTALVSTEWGFARNNTYRVIAAVGMTPLDVKALLGSYLIPGSRPFLEGELHSCIIPDSMARQLNISVGDSLVFQGLRLMIVGVFNASLLEAHSPKELDGYSLAPIDPHYVAQIGLGVTIPAQQVPPPLAWSAIIVIPYELGIELGGYVSMVPVMFPNVEQDMLSKVSRLLSITLDVPVIASNGNRVSALSRYYSFTAIGWEMIPIVLVIGVLNAMVTLLGNFKERIREMFVFASLGLTPLGASMMYIIESITYASLSITLGYFIGFIFNNLMISTGLLPAQFTFNYASVFVVISLVVLILTAFASSLYVATSAATIITPSLERRWKPPTKPRKGVWEVPLPVSLPSREEAIGLLEFLREYYEGLGAERAAFSIRSLEADFNQLTLRCRVALAPYELGITQTVEVSIAFNEGEKRFRLNATMKHETGSEQMWERLSYYFLDDMRKQLLLWRSLNVEEHRKYMERAFRV
ncbi:MAG: ABC transporter permease, partial [Thermofilaceae archaeon]